MTDRVDVKLEGIDGLLALLQSLPAEMVSKRGGPVAAGLRKGARVIRAQEIDTLQRLIGESDESTGLLLKSIIVSRGKAPFGSKGERYLVRVKNRTYPGTGKSSGTRPVTTQQVAFLFEYGTEKQPPRSFIVSAFKARAREAMDVAIKETIRATERVVKRLARQNRTRSVG